MNYKVYKLSFNSPVHFGKNQLSDSEYSICSDTVFSALCIETLCMGEGAIDKIVDLARNGDLIISDALPYIKDTYLIPKPYVFVDKESDENSSVLKKAFKKLKYITFDDIDAFVNGSFDVMNAVDISDLGVEGVKVSASVRNEEEQTVPYDVGYYLFNEDCGLYIIAGFKNGEAEQLLDSIFDQLQHSGLGGKRSSGYGRFTYVTEPLDDRVVDRIDGEGTAYFLLNTALPKESELSDAVVEARYSLAKRSGFIASVTYSDTTQRKKDLVMFKAGSCFKNRFEGDVYDVSSEIGKHPVYRYGKPMFMRINI